MQLAATAPRPASFIGIDAPSYTTPEQPYRNFLSDVSNARNSIEHAHTLVAGPQPMHLLPNDYLAQSVVEARKGIELLTSATAQLAPKLAHSSAAGALVALQAAVSLATNQTTFPLDPADVARLYQTALTQVDKAIAHSSMMFAL